MLDETAAPGTKAHDIRSRIAANARKRAEIAESMKADAGVQKHDLTRENRGGLAYTDHGNILAPAGENIAQLATLAHECGHIFLHRRGSPGYWLPGHVKELEAESYAHQAFRAHGMNIPKRLTDDGRRYVGQWIEADRASGIRIDPRAVAYAAGHRSPYEPLRDIPDAWREKGITSLAPQAAHVELPALRLRWLVWLLQLMTRSHTEPMPDIDPVQRPSWLNFPARVTWLATVWLPLVSIYYSTVRPVVLTNTMAAICFFVVLATVVSGAFAVDRINRRGWQRRRAIWALRAVKPRQAEKASATEPE